MSRRQKAVALLGLMGVLGLVSGGFLDYLRQFHFNPGDLLLLAAAVVWAVCSVIGRWVMRGRSPVSATALSALLALISVTVSGLYYFFSQSSSGATVARRRAASRVSTVKNQAEEFLAGNLKSVRILAGLPEIERALTSPTPENIERANLLLGLVRGALEGDIIYLLDKKGTTIASSNRFALDSFVGQNFAFSPYYLQAMQGP